MMHPEMTSPTPAIPKAGLSRTWIRMQAYSCQIKHASGCAPPPAPTPLQFLLPATRNQGHTQMKQGAQGQCAGTTLRDGVEREVGGFRIGDACAPVADPRCWMAKPPQYCKGISLQLQ